MGIIFTILGVYTAYNLWTTHTGLAIFVIIATLYQISSFNEIIKEESGMQSVDTWQASINILSSFVITGLFIYSFLI